MTWKHQEKSKAEEDPALADCISTIPMLHQMSQIADSLMQLSETHEPVHVISNNVVFWHV